MIILPLDIVAAYAIEHRGRPWLSTQPGGLVAFADPQPRVAQKDRSSNPNRLESIYVAHTASLVPSKGHTTLTGSPPKSIWLVQKTVVSRPSLRFLPVLPSRAHRPESDQSTPLRSLGSLLHPEKRPLPPVIASQPRDFNIPDPSGLVCPASIRTASTTSLPHMQSRIQTGSGPARNPMATLGFSW